MENVRLRVISGDFRGKRLYTPTGKAVRPTSDKVKESIFNMIAAHLEDAVVLDAFAGTGGLGIEALSRGADKAYFMDNSNESISLIKKNIDHCTVNDRARVIFGSFDRVADKIVDKLDIIFLDPPYFKALLPESLQLICDLDMLSDDGIIVVEHPMEQDLPDTFSTANGENSLDKQKERRYGSIKVSIYEKGTLSRDV